MNGGVGGSGGCTATAPAGTADCPATAAQQAAARAQQCRPEGMRCFSPCFGQPLPSAQQWRPSQGRPGRPWRPAERCLRGELQGTAIMIFQHSSGNQVGMPLQLCPNKCQLSSGVHSSTLTPGGGHSRQHEAANALHEDMGVHEFAVLQHDQLFSWSVLRPTHLCMALLCCTSAHHPHPRTHATPSI